MTRYKVMVEEEDGWTYWIRPLDPYKFRCCDCGLVHNLEFRVDDNGNVNFRGKRNNRATAQIRRKRKDG